MTLGLHRRTAIVAGGGAGIGGAVSLVPAQEGAITLDQRNWE